MKLLKILFYILLLILLIFVIAFAVLAIFFNPDQLRPIIINEVKRQTGYQLIIDGKMAWSFYPQIGVKIDHMTLSLPNETPFLDLQSVNIAGDTMQIIKRQEKLNGSIYISKVRLDRLHATNAHIDLNWQGNVLTFDPITASLYGGSLKAIAHGKQLSGIPHWDWQAYLENVQLKSLLEDTNGANSKIKISGVGHINLQASTFGKSSDEIVNNLNGNSDFGVNNGVLEGIDVNFLIQSADALINKQPLPAQTANQTPFDNFTGTAVITNGIADVHRVMLTSAAFSATTHGNINFRSKTLNLDLEIKPLQNKDIAWLVPVKISGPLNSPDVRLDLGEIKKVIIKNQIDNVKERVRDEIKENLPKAGKFLKNLFGK